MTEVAERWRPVLLAYDPLKAGSIDGTDSIPHDRAIFRAMNAKYKPNTELRSDSECTIFVGRLSKNTVESDLQEYFKKFGEIVSVHLIRDVVTGFSKCYAFVEFVERRDARDAQRANGARIDGREIIVEMECCRTMKGWVPRRLGGGFSGRKESGQLRFGGNQRPFKRPIGLMNQNRLKEEFGTPYVEKPPVRMEKEKRQSAVTPSQLPENRRFNHSSTDRSRFRSRSRQRDDDCKSRDRREAGEMDKGSRDSFWRGGGGERRNGRRGSETGYDKSRNREHRRDQDQRSVDKGNWR